MKRKTELPQYYVTEKYIKCVVTNSEGRHVLATASQKTLKRLYEKRVKEISKR